MSGPLGLSIGTANLVAARTGSAPVTRASVLTMYGHRPPEVGTPSENPRLDESGLLLGGFVERVGDDQPLAAADGTRHPAAALTAAALDGMARSVGGAPVAIAVPGHWHERQVAALRAALREYPALAPEAPPAFICDGTAALAALYAQPGFPSDGGVVLCDFGASGSSITLTDAAANFRQIAPTLRYSGFSGNQLDQAIMRHVASNMGADAANTAPLAPLGRRLEQCRNAKEQLSSATVAVIPADLPGVGSDVRLTRGEFEELIEEPLQRFIDCVVNVLQRNQIPAQRLAAVATVGGGACIPLITNQLSERLQAPVVTTSQPLLSAAIGAAVLAQLRSPAGAPGPCRAVGAPATVAGQAPAARTEGVAATEVGPTAWAAGTAHSAAGQAAADGDQSATYRALAWSQEASSGEVPIPAREDELVDHEEAGAIPPSAEVSRGAPQVAARPRRRPWLRRSAVLVSTAGAAALVLLVAAGLAVRLGGVGNRPTDNVRNVTPPVESSRLAPPVTTSAAPVSPTSESTESQPPRSTVTTTQPPATTTSPTTTYPTTTYPTSTHPTTSYPTTPYPTTSLPTPYPATTYPTTPYPVAPYPTVSQSVAPAYPTMPTTAIEH
ncbi:MAG: Hsp70 family protein [Actinomycetota bacterium]|nr:Hsp70 family protein [Actinomycetota bacterium]